MKKRGLLMILVTLLTGMVLLASHGLAQDADATEEAEADALLARGAYLIYIAGCIDCHTPYKPEYEDFSKLTPEQLQTLGLRALDAQDIENRALAGGRPFDLGPAGVLFSANITSDEDTGIGSWSDLEIEIAIRIGVSPDGSRLHPLMPYVNFYNLSRYDMQAIIAYLRTVPAVENKVEHTLTGDGIAPELVLSTELPEAAPDGSDPVELGRYLVTAVMSCTDCHTPLDPETGAPMMEQFLGGGQPYEGPWGIVYGANITPDEATGIGTWTPDDIVRVFREGVRIDGRRLVLMPWQTYQPVTDEDLSAIIAFLKEGLTPVSNEIPLPSINELFLQHVESE